ncbi:nucleotide exchange factor GrpE [Candidatus Parvarchaeota archaeon]|nr:nucleotide exchange factor GrpE [Candidatus Parvarchaeota archaeon]
MAEGDSIDAEDEKKEELNVGDKEDYKAKYLYLLAEIDNYRKARDKESTDYAKFASEKIMLSMLKILDDFESVMKVDNDAKIEVLFKSLNAVLSSNGLQKMDVIGKDYSPDIAEAVITEPTKEGAGKILEEIQSGYTLNGKIIRYPKVKISV